MNSGPKGRAMLAHRVIPTLLCRGRQLVKGKAFDSWRSVGVAAQAVRLIARAYRVHYLRKRSAAGKRMLNIASYR